MPQTHVPVLIAGGGTVGLATALFLAHHGVSPLVTERQDGPSTHPRATGIGPRTAEFFREVGIDEAVDAAAIDMSAGNLGKLSARTLTQADFTAQAASPLRPRRAADPFDAVGPARLHGTCPQDRLDSVLLTEASRRGATVRYATRLVSFEQENDGVTAVLDGPAGRRLVRADYLVAADGGHSGVRDTLGIGTSGPGKLGRAMLLNILFHADLRPHTKGMSFVNCTITHPDVPGLLVTVDGEKNWIFHTRCDPDAGETADDFTTARCRTLIRTAVGDAGLDVRVRSVLPWRPRGLLADRFADGRVLLAGDAAHTVPPIGAFGLNTGIADAHNLAWKLASVLHGHAGPALLDSYPAERRPVAALTLHQAMLRYAEPGLHWDTGPRADAARAAAGVLPAPVVHLGYRYDSGAVVDPRPDLPSREDVELLLDGTPGSRIPHIWLERDGRRLSTVDLAASRFTLLAGPGGEEWLRAARTVADRLGVDLAAHRIAPDTEVADPSGRWPRVVGLADDGALLVRPDGFVAWRSPTGTARPDAELAHALTRVLARAVRSPA